VHAPAADDLPMSASVLTGLVGVLGAVVGGLAAVAGTWWHGRAEQRRADAVRADARRDLRREACVGYLAALDLYRERARDLLGAISGGSADGRAVAQSRYQQSWRALVDALAAVQIAGPERVSAAGTTVHDAATSYGLAVDARLEGGRGASAPGPDLERRLGDARREFAGTARTALSLDA
jgi:hypothetical protein